ncbi:hypothetical protein DDB_G0272048 [Dictyostelium discoideum AX4]|uniref:Nudix hydrolase domain-containing protein n=1 Tax=Dictyostelium discoideum TaxID=44689 RepID=Q55A74_DICDI|nr:hypothetical protein DDB_G0272048 [Dictyostelium discoideum AX4]EAL71458.1 hypothetical protein DDB_G0272048 [Dictyostelium discoideum AX4]|eukprot:XP_645392.1 hypothetical protein DDB_G0272048 [Dictyostelium discoideum AX4]
MSLLIESIFFSNKESSKDQKDNFLNNFLKQGKFKEIIKSSDENETNKILNEYKSDYPIVAILIHILIDKQVSSNESSIMEFIDNKTKTIVEYREKRKMNSFIVTFIDIDDSTISMESKRRDEINDKLFPMFLCKLFKNGSSLVTNKINDVIESLKIVETTSIDKSGDFKCTICHKSGFATNLSQDHLREHIFIFHCNCSLNDIENSIPLCPICNIRPMERMGVHLHESHGEKGAPTEKQLSLSKIYAFCLVVVRKRSNNTYLLVNEAAGRGYWLPGGKLNVNEALQQCAIRETKEETGIDIELKGILRVEFSPMVNYSRMRVIFYAEPIDENQPPRLIPNYESMGAIYVPLDQLTSFNLRGKEPTIWFNYVDKNKPIHPLSLLALEGSLPK